MANRPRIHLTGASCSGVSTLGAALAERFGVHQLDVDDFYWMPTDPPFISKRPPEERVRLIRERQSALPGWVLSGSFMGWGETLIRDVDLVVFVETPTSLRLQRLDRREAERYGARIRPGGDMHEAHLAFRDWASRYDDPGFSGRNRAQHERWLATQSAPLLRVDGQCPTSELVALVIDELARQDPGKA